MNKNKVITILCLTVLGATFFVLKEIQKPKEQVNSHKLDKRTRADLANLQNYEMTKDPQTGEVPRYKLWEAIEQLRLQSKSKEKAAISGISWTERGPNNVSGRTRTAMYDPNDATHKRVFAGSVSGGLWVCNNVYASTTSWAPVDEFLENLAITSIAYDPTNPSTMYFGTGEGFFNIDAVRGDGIFKTTNGGTSWSRLSSTTGSVFNYIQKIVVDASGNIYAATRNGGIQKSTNGGTSWSTILSTAVPSTGTKAAVNRAADIEIASNGAIYVAMGIFQSDGIYKSTNSGTSWSKVYTASGEHRIELACAPSNSDYVYALTQDAATDAEKNFLRSTNGGTNWTTLSPPSSFSAQTWYNIGLSIDPNDETALYAGGLDLWKSTNSGTSFSKVAYWSGNPYVHADHHLALFAPGSSDSILFGTDGGIYLTTNGTSASPSFTFQSTGYNVTQFYSCAAHPTAGENYFLAGAQDNGSHKFTAAGTNGTTEVTGGDGGFVFIDQDDPTYQFTSYVFNQYRVSTNNGASFSNVNFSSSAGMFINPTDYDNNAHIMYSSYGNGQYLRWTNPRSGTTNSVVTFSASGTNRPSALFCDPNTANRLYIGTEDGEVWRINNANASASAANITPSGLSGYVSCIDVENGDANHILVTVSNYSVTSVYESTNGGTNWTAVEGNLPDMPIRWCMFNPMNGDKAFVATELGVWSTDNLNGTSTNWGATNNGLANVRTDMLQWRASDSTLIAATHGRGLYSTSFSLIVEADFVADKKTLYLYDDVAFTDVSTGATSWAWDFDNDGVTDATTKNASWSYAASGYKTVKLTINGTTPIVKTNYITVLPNLGTPYTVGDGGNFENNGWHFGGDIISGSTNKWELGSPSNTISNTASGSNVWKTDLDADLPSEDYKCALYTPSFNLANSGTYSLSFKYRMDVEFGNAPFGVFVEYSINGGNNWNQLGTYNASNNWYSTSSHDVVASGHAWSHNVTSYQTATQNISSLAGNSDVRFRIVLEMQSGWGANYNADGFALDDFSLSGPSNNATGLPIETVLNSTATFDLGPNATVTFISSNLKILATIQNLSSHNYGATTVTIDNAGTSTKNFSTNTATSKQIMDKTITISPTNNNSSGIYKITTYYTDAEAAAWKTNTGNYFAGLALLKSPSSISTGTLANSVYGTNIIIDSAYKASGIAITSNFSTGFSGFGAGAGGAGGALPVVLVSFDAKRLNAASLLTWRTASEQNSSHFEIERSLGGYFVKIGKVFSNGNSTQLRTYTYYDTEKFVSNKTVLYRLKTVDLDGSFNYSNTIQLRLVGDNEVVLYPLPTKDYIHVALPEYMESVDVKIVDLNGVLQTDVMSISDTSPINVAHLKSGTYFMLISENGRLVNTKKFIKQ